MLCHGIICSSRFHISSPQPICVSHLLHTLLLFLCASVVLPAGICNNELQQLWLHDVNDKAHILCTYNSMLATGANAASSKASPTPFQLPMQQVKPDTRRSRVVPPSKRLSDTAPFHTSAALLQSNLQLILDVPRYSPDEWYANPKHDWFLNPKHCKQARV